MRYTPVELRHLKIARSFRGYNREDTDRLIEDIADSFEEVWRERGELADKLEEIEKRLETAQEREGLLASTLVAAERVAAEARDAAKREAELILAEAHGAARSVTRTAQSERERLFTDARRIESQLRAALGMIQATEDRGPAAAAEPPSGAPPTPRPGEHWPRRDDTREFEAVVLPDAGEALEAASEGEPEPPAAHSQVSDPPRLPPVSELEPEPEPGADGGPWAGRDFAWG